MYKTDVLLEERGRLNYAQSQVERLTRDLACFQKQVTEHKAVIERLKADATVFLMDDHWYFNQ